MIYSLLGFKVQEHSFFKFLVQQTQVNTIPTLFLLRHHQQYTHGAWDIMVFKDCPQVDLVKTGFI